MGRTVIVAGAAWMLAGQLHAQGVEPPPLFQSDEPLRVTFTADFSALKDDRRESPERPATVRVGDTEIEAQLRTRGRFRLDNSNCTFPPLRLNLKKKQTAGTAFEGEDKLKVVAPCRPNRESYQQLIFSEYLVYRALSLLTDSSFRVRLAEITYVDESGEDEPLTRMGFFIEDDEMLAERLGATVFELPEGGNLPPGALDPPTAALVGVFQYMIGNTDWSDIAGHNIEILDLMGIAITVPYDFDFSGIVDAPYAVPDSKLGIKSVTERYYRGWCHPGMDMEPVLARFRDAQAEILALYEDFPYLDDGTRRSALNYLEAFFEDIETPERAQRRFLRDCRAKSR